MSACPIPIDSLSAAAKRAADPSSPGPARMMAARGLAPMAPRDLVTAQFVLTFDGDAKIADAAKNSLSNLDPRLANAVLGDQGLNPIVLGYLAEALVARDADVEKILLNNSTPDDAFIIVAASGSEAVCEVIANNQARLLKAPDIARSLTHNTKALKSTVERVIDFLVRNGIILDGVPEFDSALLRLTGQEREQAAAAVEVPEELLDARYRDESARAFVADDGEDYLGDDDDAGERRMIADDDDLAAEDDEKVNITQLIKGMTTGQKVALAVKGNRQARSILMRETNRVIALAVISSPTLTEIEAVHAAQSRTVHQDVIAYIARQKEWMKNYQIKNALAGNPKCPLPIAMKLVPLLMKKDQRQLSNSKNVPMGVRNLATRLSRVQ